MPIDTDIYQTTPLVPPPNALSLAQGYASTSNALTENQLLKNQLGAQNEMTQILASGTKPDGTRDYGKINQLLQNSQFGAINAPKFLDMQNAQDQPQNVFNNDTGKYEYRPLQGIQLLAHQQQKEQVQRQQRQQQNRPQNGLTGSGQGQSQNNNASPDPSSPQITSQDLAPLPGTANPLMQAPPQSQQQSPQGGASGSWSQQDIDKVHDHNQGVISLLTPLANDPNLTEKKIMDTTIEAMNDPKIQFNAHDAALLLSKLPPNATHQQLQQLVTSALQHQQQGAQILAQKMPSSSMLQSAKPSATQTTASPNEPMSDVSTEAQAQNDGQPQPQEGNQSTTSENISPQPAPGVLENQAVRQKHYLDVQNAANSVPQENAALNNILNISKSGAASGTMVGQMYQALASTGLAPEGITDTGAQLKLIQNHAAQIATSGGMPGSDARLAALENAKVGSADLPQVIQAMVPYLLAVNKGKLQQAQYYQNSAGNGLDPNKVSQAQTTWNQNFDPRLLEMRSMQNDPAALKKYISNLAPEDKKELLEKHRSSKQLGLINE